jgi:uncharacterized BrkB/YihY/UPF0761 family membrane protein
MSISSRSRTLLWLTLIVIVILGVVVVFMPAWIIQPFKPQTERGVALSYVLRSWSPLVTLTASFVGVAIMIFLWKNVRRWWLKVLLVVLILPLFAATWLARQNHFEWMFNPLPNAAYAKVSSANYLADADMLLAVENNGEAAAYPIRLMAYHHVVQDVVGGTALVATY